MARLFKADVNELEIEHEVDSIVLLHLMPIAEHQCALSHRLNFTPILIFQAINNTLYCFLCELQFNRIESIDFVWSEAKIGLK